MPSENRFGRRGMPIEALLDRAPRLSAAGPNALGKIQHPGRVHRAPTVSESHHQSGQRLPGAFRGKVGQPLIVLGLDLFARNSKPGGQASLQSLRKEAVLARSLDEFREDTTHVDALQLVAVAQQQQRCLRR